MLRTVHLHGRLGERFGRQHRLEVSSPAEAVRALSFLHAGFREHVRDGRYAVTAGSGTFPDKCAAFEEAEALELQLGKQTDIHIAPEGVVAGIETILLIGILAFTAIAAVASVLLLKAPKAADREEKTKITSFVFDGAENSLEQGHPVQLVYGELRVGSIVASSGITTADVAGIGGYGGGTGGGSAGVYNASITGVAGGQAGVVGTTDGFTGEFTPPDLAGDVGIIVYGGGGGKAGGGTAPVEDPNSLQSAATARVLEIISEGEIVGLVDGMKSVYLDETPLQNPDGTFNFKGVLVEQRVGLPDQDYIQGFAQTENTVNVSTQLKVLVGPLVRSVTNPDATAARVTIRTPALVSTDSKGNIKGTKVEIKIEVQTDGGGYVTAYTMTINGKTNSGYERAVEVLLPPGNVRNVRVTRLTADSTVSTLQNDTYWTTLTEIVEAKLSYPDTAMIALTVDARQFGSNIPGRGYLIRGLIIEVPSNYDVLTRVYTGVWNGVFKRAWSNNPAWILRDLIINRRYGLGARVPESAVDKWALYAIAQYCDGLVPDGLGGTQPRFTLNTSINSPLQAYDLLASIAASFRGLVYWSSGSVIATQDRPEDPTILLTPANVVKGKFRYGRSTSHDKRRSAAVVYWNNPTDGFKLTPAVYEDADLIRRFGRRTGQEVTAFGVTNEGQAIRMAKWILEDERPDSNRTVLYDVGDDHAFVEPGRVAMIADPMFAGVRRGGRVRASAANSVTIDVPFTFVAGQAYSLRVILPDGSVIVRVVSNAAGTTDVVTLTGAAFAANPNAGAVWSIESATVANRQWRIRAIETDDFPFSVRATSHDPTKYARVELNQNLAPPNYGNLPTGPLGLPFDLGATEFLQGEGTASIPCVLFGWSPPDDPRVLTYQAHYRRVGEEWIDLGDGSLTSRTVRNITPGSYEFRVRGLDATGRLTPWVAGTGTMDGQADLMPEVVAPGLVINSNLFSAKLAWFKPTDTRPLRYEIMFHATGVYASASVLGTTDRLEYTVTEPGTYWVRTRFMDFRSPAPVAIPVAAIVFSAGIIPSLTNEAALVAADAAGVVTSYSGASGSFVIMSGSTDISSNFTLSIPAGGNPQALTVNLVARTYTVTAGLDAGEPTATLVLRATGSGTYAGVVLDKVFSLGKSQVGATGATGITGATGNFIDAKFIRSLAQPATPTGNAPAGWSDGIPTGTNTIWEILGTKTQAGVLIGVWSTPKQITALAPRGAYSGTATYYLNNTVTHAGGSYIAVQDNFTGQAPSGTANATAYWDVLSAPGSAGTPATAPSAFTATIAVPSGAAVNLRALADAAGYTGLSNATVTFEVNAAAVARGLSGGGIGIDQGVWPHSSYTIALTLVVKNGGIVDGGGGAGNGGNGGDAIYLRGPMTGGITIDAGGIVRSGGGGGGIGGTRTRSFVDGEGYITYGTYGGGGGGGGAPNGVGGAGDVGDTTTGSNGSPGTTGGGGAGGAGAGAGGAGANFNGSGTAGSTSSGLIGTYGYQGSGGPGGVPGYAVRKNGYAAAVLNNGTMTGTAG